MKKKPADKKPKGKTIDLSNLLWVEILPAKDPNKGEARWPEWWTQSLRFLRYNRPVACMECGKKKKIMWTMLCEFRPQDMSQFTMFDGKILPPLSPVCGEHPLRPNYPKE